ncbi:pleckstrin homology domain-containing family A member 3-like [Cloeon dipterum]|uniref:pleckstrin homology domain-containing family A member 3-like n=1 Tax=Cloeon dipterum TaxID=197152 RepID=UPI0032205D45
MKESSSPDSMKHKKSELRLYCDLLMQQAHMVKESACKQNPPDVEKLEEATTLLSATCDSFIETLEACSKLAHEQFQMDMPSLHPSESVIRHAKNHKLQPSNST